MLKHDNIIGFIGQRIESNIHYVFLEYATGGELFDRIGKIKKIVKHQIPSF